LDVGPDHTGQDEPSGRARLDLRRINDLSRPERTRLLLGTVALFVGTGTALAAPALVGQLLDGVTEGSGRADLNRAAILLLGLFAVSGVATAFRAYLFTVAGERIVAQLRTDLYSAVIRRDIAFFDGRRTGELINRLASDTTVLQNAVTVNLSMALRNLLQTVGAVVLLLWISWPLTLVMLAVVPVVAVGAGVYGRSLRKVSKRVQDALARASEVAEETMGGIRTVRTFDSEAAEIRRYGAAVDESYQLARHRARLMAVFMGGMSFAGYGAIAAVLWYGGVLLGDGQLSFGQLTSFILYTFTVAFSIASLSGLWSEFAKASGASERFFDLLDEAPPDVAEGRRPDVVEGELSLDDVHFAYPTRPDAAVLQGLSMRLQPDRVVALVGPSGGGKSTVAALLSRLYEPDRGQLLLDGTPIVDLDPHWLRQQVGVVSQEPILFATTITNNIRYAVPEASDEQVRAAAEAANALQFIDEFPEGFDTLVGERGVRLSGGQKQRIAIARALLKDPAVLILDEATSALDAESEHLVQEALERLMKGRTTLVIAHRLSTVKQADQVVVLDGGKVAESGSHDELLALDGLYRRLVERQFAD
jgi:ATP-binding cassette subfamily B protein